MGVSWPTLVLERDPDSGEVRATGITQYSQGYRLPGDWDGIPQGVWAEWHWDGSELTVRNDRLGFSPLFWFATPTRVGVSPSVAALVPHLEDRELDDDAIAVFLRFRSYIGEDTPFRQVRSLPPGANFRWSQGVARLDALGPIRFDAEPGARQRWQPEYPGVVREAMRRALDSTPGRVAIPLSGGLDSRLVLFSMLALGRRPDLCVTVRQQPPRTDEDAVLAAELTAETGVPHRILEQERDRLGQQLRNLSRTHLCTHEHGWYQPVADFLRAEKFDAYVDGIAGDLQAEPNYITQGMNRLIEDGRMTDAISQLLDEGYLPAVLPAAMHRRWSHDRAVAHMTERASAFQGAADPWGNFRLYARTRRNIALLTWSLHFGGAVGLAPFLDRSVVELLGPIPWQELADRTFRKQVVAEGFPQWQARPGTPAHFHSSRGRRELRAYGRAVARWAGRRMLSSPVLRPSFLPPRLLRAHVDRGYTREVPMACELPVYLLELQRWAEGGDPCAFA